MCQGLTTQNPLSPLLKYTAGTASTQGRCGWERSAFRGWKSGLSLVGIKETHFAFLSTRSPWDCLVLKRNCYSAITNIDDLSDIQPANGVLIGSGRSVEGSTNERFKFHWRV